MPNNTQQNTAFSEPPANARSSKIHTTKSPTVLDRLMRDEGSNTNSLSHLILSRNAAGVRGGLSPPSVVVSKQTRARDGLPPLSSSPTGNSPWPRRRLGNEAVTRSQSGIIDFADGGVFSDDFTRGEERRGQHLPKRLTTPKLARKPSLEDGDDDSHSDVDGMEHNTTSDAVVPASVQDNATTRDGSSAVHRPQSHSSSAFLNRPDFNSQTMTPFSMSFEDPKPPAPRALPMPLSPSRSTQPTVEDTSQPFKMGISSVLLKGFRLQNVLPVNPLVAFFRECPLSLLEEAISHRRTTVLQPQQFYQWCVHLLWLDNPNSGATAGSMASRKNACLPPIRVALKSEISHPKNANHLSSATPTKLRPLGAAGSYFSGRASSTRPSTRDSAAGSSSEEEEMGPEVMRASRSFSVGTQSASPTPRKSLLDPVKHAVVRKQLLKDQDRQLVQRLRTPIRVSPGRPLLELSNKPLEASTRGSRSLRPDPSDSDDELSVSTKPKGDAQAMWRMMSSTPGSLSATEIEALKRKVTVERARKLRNYLQGVKDGVKGTASLNSRSGSPSEVSHRGDGASASATLAVEDPVGRVMRGSCETVPFTRSEALELFQALDSHDDGVLDFRELCEGVICMRSADGHVIPFLHRFSTLVRPYIHNKDVRLVRISRQEVQYMSAAAVTVFMRRRDELVALREAFIVANQLFAAPPVNVTSEIAEAAIAAAVSAPAGSIPIDPLAVKRCLLVQYQSTHGHGKARVSTRIKNSDFIFPQHEEMYNALDSSQQEAASWQRFGVVVQGCDELHDASSNKAPSEEELVKGWGQQHRRSLSRSQTQEAVAEQRRAAEELGRVNAIRAEMATEAARRRVMDAYLLFSSSPSLTDTIYSLTRAHTGQEAARDGRASEYSAHSTSTTSRIMRAVPAYAQRCANILTEVDRFTMLIKLLEQYIRNFTIECDEQLLAVVGQDPVSYQLLQSIAQDVKKCPNVNLAFGRLSCMPGRAPPVPQLDLPRQVQHHHPTSQKNPKMAGGLLLPAQSTSELQPRIQPELPLAPPSGCKPLIDYVRVVLPCEPELRRSFLAECLVSNDAEEGESPFCVMSKPHQIAVDREDRTVRDASRNSGASSPLSKKPVATTLFSPDSPRVVGSDTEAVLATYAPNRSPRASMKQSASSFLVGRAVVIANHTYPIGGSNARNPQKNPNADESDDDDDSNSLPALTVRSSSTVDPDPKSPASPPPLGPLHNIVDGDAHPVSSSISINTKLHKEKHLAVQRRKVTMPDMTRVDSPEFNPPEFVTIGGKLIELHSSPLGA